LANVVASADLLCCLDTSALPAADDKIAVLPASREQKFTDNQKIAMKESCLSVFQKSPGVFCPEALRG
jgi:hypothetical protein